MLTYTEGWLCVQVVLHPQSGHTCVDLSDDDMPEMITGVGELISPIDPYKDELLVLVSWDVA